jgi:hypothetical protein
LGAALRLHQFRPDRVNLCVEIVALSAGNTYQPSRSSSSATVGSPAEWPAKTRTADTAFDLEARPPPNRHRPSGKHHVTPQSNAAVAYQRGPKHQPLPRHRTTEIQVLGLSCDVFMFGKYYAQDTSVDD